MAFTFDINIFYDLTAQHRTAKHMNQRTNRKKKDQEKWNLIVKIDDDED